MNEFVELCYNVVGRKLEKIYVDDRFALKDYFCFSSYIIKLDVKRQMEILHETKSLEEGLRESFEWYTAHPDWVTRRPYIEFIDTHIKNTI